MEVLNLDHILGLSEKTLISLFSDVESNEMKRTYIYTCYLMPKQCQKQCTSFGSEMRAYAEIKKHLYQHLDELKKEALCKKLFFSCLDDTEVVCRDQGRRRLGRNTLKCLSIGTPKNNKFSICSKWKIHNFKVSQNLGRVQPHYNVLEYWDP